MEKEKLARALRVVTAPPVLIIATLIVLNGLNVGVFRNVSELAIAILLLGVFPALAYPLQALIPQLRGKGRDGQRKLAFILTLVGYTLGMVVVLVGGANPSLSMVYIAYFLSVVLLTIVNKCFHEKASGHACSTAGSLVFAMYFIGPAAIIPCVLLYAGMAWSSVLLSRHTPRNLVTGTATFLVAFAITVLTSCLF